MSPKGTLSLLPRRYQDTSFTAFTAEEHKKYIIYVILTIYFKGREGGRFEENL